ncbi:simple sugar transport system ATP-binding protein [Oribacterium sinus]|uniref:Simple sugar transport system ATP-binding protein n=3 Tax=Oribacterium sinus TaxID=237576 RepID=A0A7W9SFC3_9FIRM|nr:ABC transporter ATP-binding protein [Oribacterium sinus]MBB6040455.1 simple sugar transport system ATP-binding protein [Oribacterium sinus]
MSEFVVEMKNIVKSFGEVHAVKDGQFNLIKGEIHSLIGENGAGKSTMMKLLYGMYPIDSGEIIVKGQSMGKLDPKLAIQHGIGMVHQEFMLVNDLTVLENVILGFEPKKGLQIDFDKARKEIQHFIDQYNMEIQLDKKVSQISVGEAQRVEIIKTLMRGADIIILDEPTAVLTPQETKKLFEILNNLKKEQKSLVFISHKLNEVMEISDRISVMRQGLHMGIVSKEETSPLDLTKKMIGREVFLHIDKTYEKAGKKILDVQDVWIPSQKESSKIRGLSLHVNEGEIVGIAGIDGNGQSELIEAITGLRPVERGHIFLDGKEITNLSPKKVREVGLAHIPEDRNTRGLNRTMSIEENLVAVEVDKAPFSRGMVMNTAAMDRHSEEMVKRFDIRPTDYKLPTSSLSGGNAQKVVVAREVSMNKKLLVAAQPTRGVDIGAIESIQKTLEEAKKNGAGVLLVSTELEEITSLSDRIIVIHEGTITGELSAGEANENNLGLLMMGGTVDHQVKEDMTKQQPKVDVEDHQAKEGVTEHQLQEGGNGDE